jgi:putative membrane protein
MKNTFLALSLALATAGILAGCATHRHDAGNASMGAGAATTSASSTMTTTSTPAMKLSPADVQFVAVAAGAGMYEVEAGRVAASRAMDPKVKAYAQMLVEHHSANNRELMAIVQSKGQSVAPGLPPELQQKVSRLSGMQGAEFDRNFVRMTGVQDHSAAINAFEQGRRTVTDRDLQAYIDKTLPTLRSHLQQAQTIAGGMAG